MMFVICRQEAEIQQLISLHDKVSGLSKTSIDRDPHLRDQLFYSCLVVFLRSLHSYMSATEPALAGSKFISTCLQQFYSGFPVCVDSISLIIFFLYITDPAFVFSLVGFLGFSSRFFCCFKCHSTSCLEKLKSCG